VADGGEAGEVAVECGDGGAVLDGDRSEYGVGDEVSGGVALVAQATEDREVSRTGGHGEVARLRNDGVDEGEDIRAWAGYLEDSAVGGQAEV